jgi:hypothetical protein
VIQPSFHLSVLEGFVSTFYNSAELMVEKIKARSDLSEINITSPINDCVFNILHGEYAEYGFQISHALIKFIKSRLRLYNADKRMSLRKRRQENELRKVMTRE